MASAAGSPPPFAARERILESAYELFTHRRVREVGINEVIHHARVTKSTFYSHFPSKDALVLAFLDLREQRATIDWLKTGAYERGSTPAQRLLAMFDLLDEWFHSEDFAGCPFINILLEFGSDHPNGGAAADRLATMRTVVEKLAAEAGLRDQAKFARSFHLLMKGAIIGALEGESTAAMEAKELARILLEQHRWRSILARQLSSVQSH